MLRRRLVEFSGHELSPHTWRVKLIQLGLFFSPLLAAYFYSYTNSQSPLFCPVKAFTGIPCPGCGMTRGFMALTQGNLGDAIGYNLFSPILFAGFALTVMHLLLEILTRRHILAFYSQWLKNNYLQLSALSALLIYHSLRLYQLEQTGELYLNFSNSPLGKMFF